jgi:CheY-like chemotaxis protein
VLRARGRIDGAGRTALGKPAKVAGRGLPGLDGHEVATALRQQPAAAQVRLIAITAYGSVADRQRSQKVGFERHLVKPVDPSLRLELLAAG